MANLEEQQLEEFKKIGNNIETLKSAYLKINRNAESMLNDCRDIIETSRKVREDARKLNKLSLFVLGLTVSLYLIIVVRSILMQIL